VIYICTSLLIYVRNNIYRFTMNARVCVCVRAYNLATVSSLSLFYTTDQFIRLRMPVMSPYVTMTSQF